RSRRRRVEAGHAQAGHRLQRQRERERRTEDAPPTGERLHYTGSFFVVGVLKRRHATEMRPSLTSTSSASSGRGDGPDWRSPVGEKRLSWHGQTNARPSASQSTAQPACGQTVDSARTLSPSRTSQQPPSVTSV